MRSSRSLVVYLIGAAGAPIRVVTGWQPDGADLTLVEVVIASITWVMIGAAALWLMERRLTRAFRRWVVLASATTVASLAPLLGPDVDAGSKLASCAMHIVTGALTSPAKLSWRGAAPVRQQR